MQQKPVSLGQHDTSLFITDGQLDAGLGHGTVAPPL